MACPCFEALRSLPRRILAATATPAASATLSVRQREQPAHAELFTRILNGEDEAAMEGGIAEGVSLTVFQGDGWSSWQDPWANGCKRGGLSVFSPPSPIDGVFIFFVHGGSFEYGSPTSSGYDSLNSKIAAATNVTVVCPDHPLSGDGRSFEGPEIIPALANDFLKHLQSTVDKSGSSRHVKAILAGDSAGANQAVGLLLYLLQEHSQVVPSLSGVALISPWMDLTCGSHTYVSNAFSKEEHTGDVCFREPADQNRACFRDYGLRYAGSTSLMKDPLYSPYWIARGARADLLDALTRARVPLWMCIGASEALAGEVLDFAQRLRGKVRMEVWLHEGMFHDWVMYKSEFPFPTKDANFRNLVDFLERVARPNAQLSEGIHYYIDEWTGDETG